MKNITYYSTGLRFDKILKTEIEEEGLLVYIGLGVDSEMIYRQIKEVIDRFVLGEKRDIGECCALWSYYFFTWREYFWTENTYPTYEDERDYQVAPTYYYEITNNKEQLYPYLLKEYRDTVERLFRENCEDGDTISICVKVDDIDIQMPPMRKNEYDIAYSFLNKTLDEFEKMWREGREPKVNEAEPQHQPESPTSTSTLTNERDEAINEINTNHSLKQAFKMAKEGGLLDDNYQPTDRIKTFTQQALLADCIKIEANTSTSWQLFNKLWDIKDKNKIARQRSTTKEKIGKVRGQEIIFEVFKPQPHTNK